MQYALFLGCTIPARLTQYESSSRAVLRKLGVGLVDVEEFNCCGYPLRNLDTLTYLLSSARNLALARARNLDMIALCKCCYGSLRKADYILKENDSLREQINSLLAREGLVYHGDVGVRHLIQVLDSDVGVERIRQSTENTFDGLKIATHYGCHALRPSEVVRFDDPVSPRIFDRLVEATGARSVHWEARTDCCGAPAWGINDELSMDLTEKKLADGRRAGADYLCTACPYCQIQFDTVQQMMVRARGGDGVLPSILYTQLLGLSLGIGRESLGLELNRLPPGPVEDFFAAPEEAPEEAPGEAVEELEETDGEAVEELEEEQE